MTPGGKPARSHSSAMIIVAPGSRSEGFMIRVFPVTVAKAADHRTILEVSILILPLRHCRKSELKIGVSLT